MKVLHVLKYFWSAPLSICGLLVSLVFRPARISWSEGVIELEVLRLPGNFVAQTYGWTVLYLPWARTIEGIRRHERAHVAQCFRWGLLMAVFYPLASFLAWASGGHWYQDNAFEIQARRS